MHYIVWGYGGASCPSLDPLAGARDSTGDVSDPKKHEKFQLLLLSVAHINRTRVVLH